jgi:hypothetical protein
MEVTGEYTDVLKKNMENNSSRFACTYAALALHESVNCNCRENIYPQSTPKQSQNCLLPPNYALYAEVN